jgi:hypothetical protein
MKVLYKGGIYRATPFISPLNNVIYRLTYRTGIVALAEYSDFIVLDFNLYYEHCYPSGCK